MRIGIPKESAAGETRVAAVPETVARLVKAGASATVEAGLGTASGIADDAYVEAGASVADDPASVFDDADLLLKVRPPSDEEIALLAEGRALISLLAPRTSGELVRRLAEAKVTAFALDEMPRITRAQAMDVLSSMSTLAGYKAVLLAADALPRMMPMMMTAAGTLRPASVLVVGAGVAGLQAIATAKRLGAAVTGVDVRPAAREQVESLGAKFVPMEVDHQAEDAGGYATDLGEDFYRQEQEILAPQVRKANVVVTTALIPGRAAPRLLTPEMVESMAPGSVIVDLAAVAGGNCVLTRPGETIEHGGVRVMAPLNLPAELPEHASLMFARNAATFIEELIADGELKVDTDNPVVAGTLITRDGRIVHEAVRTALTENETR